MKQAVSTAEDELYELAPLSPRMTGLRTTVWVGPHGDAPDDVRIKVNLAPGNQVSTNSTAVIGVRPAPHPVAARLSPDDERRVFEWIRINEAAIIAYWDGTIDTAELIQHLNPLPPRP